MEETKDEAIQNFKIRLYLQMFPFHRISKDSGDRLVSRQEAIEYVDGILKDTFKP